MKKTQTMAYGVRKLFIHSVAVFMTLISFPRHI